MKLYLTKKGAYHKCSGFDTRYISTYELQGDYFICFYRTLGCSFKFPSMYVAELGTPEAFKPYYVFSEDIPWDGTLPRGVPIVELEV